MHKEGSDDPRANVNVLPMPPLRFGERFEEAYDVILILDDREQFANQGSVIFVYLFSFLSSVSFYNFGLIC